MIGLATTCVCLGNPRDSPMTSFKSTHAHQALLTSSKMAGKKGKGKKKKGNKSSDGGHIAAALMPAASILAVPRSPPLTSSIPDFENPTNSGILTSTLLGRMFLNTNEQDPSGIVSETDTSLYDYENAKAAHATLEMRAGPSGESLARSGLHLSPGPMVLDDTGDEISTDEFIDEPDVQRSHEPSIGASKERISPISKQPRKRSSMREKGPPRTSMQMFQKEDDEVMGRSPSPRYLGSSRARTPSPVTPRSPTPRTLRTPSPSLADRDGFSRSIRSDMLSTSNSKIGRLEVQQVAILDKVQQQTDQLRLQQEQLQQQYLLQQQLMERLLQQPQTQQSLQEMGTLLQSTQSVTDATLQHQDQLVGSLHQHAEVLLQEKEELHMVNEQLRAELEELRHRPTPLETVGSGDDVSIYRRQIQDLRDERKVLKLDIQRLNVELGRYIRRCKMYRDKYGDVRDEENNMNMPADGVVPSWQVNWKFLSPLFMAYDEQMTEKDALLQRFEDEVDQFKEQLQEVIKENERLHIRIEQSDITGPISMTEWRQLQEQCKLVLEENQLLMEQLDVQHNKAKDMHKAHVQEVTGLSKRVVVLDSEKTELEQYNEELRQTAHEAKKQYESLRLTTDSRLGVEEHFSLIQELKRHQEDEKLKVEHEVSRLQVKVTNLNSDKKTQALLIEDMKAENKNLGSELRNAYKLYRKSQRKEALLQRLLAEVESKEQSATKYLNDLVKMAERTVVERDTLVKVAETHEKLKKKTIQKLKEESVEKGKLTEKMKLQKLKLADVLNKAADKMKAQDKDFGSQRAEYEREMKHLRTLLRDKEDYVDALSGEKRQVEDDLETMWHVAAQDNIQMRESLRKMARQLQSHKGLAEIIKPDDIISNDNVIEIILNSEKQD